MAKVAPYHTITPEQEYGQRNVYHDHDDCPDGRRILRENKRPGTAGRPRGDACKDLDERDRIDGNDAKLWIAAGSSIFSALSRDSVFEVNSKVSITR